MDHALAERIAVTLSVVIPTTLENPVCARAFASVVRAAERVADAEILLVVNGPGSAGRTVPIQSPLVRVVRPDRTGPAAARNHGLALARYDTVLFTDDDCVVPADWCAQMATGLRATAAVVAGPVVVEAAGPITAFLSYQRFYEGLPLDATSLKWAPTLNLGVRRSRLGDRRFDEHNFHMAGEDLDFCHRVRDAGGTIGWVPGAQPVNHVLPEHIDRITGRFHNYGRGYARLMWRREGGGPEAVSFMDLLRDMPAGTWVEREFREVPDPTVRAAFRTLNMLITCCHMIGYLEQLGAEIGHSLIRIDRAGLDGGWRAVAGVLADLAAGVPVSTWQDPMADPLRFVDDRAADEPPDPVRMMAANLSDHVADVTAGLPAEVCATIDGWRNTQQVFPEELYAAVKGIADELADRRPQWTMGDLESRMRALGMGFAEGCHAIEQIASLRWTAADP
jgi:glycosyltransferase involved in cell wall biosynthesis